MSAIAIERCKHHPRGDERGCLFCAVGAFYRQEVAAGVPPVEVLKAVKGKAKLEIGWRLPDTVPLEDQYESLVYRLDGEERRRREKLTTSATGAKEEYGRFVAHMRAAVAGIIPGGATIKTRADGKGDPWANAHRACLPPDCYMQDADAIEIESEDNAALIYGEDSQFFEYATDPYGNRGKAIRNFGIAAVFDRKASRWANQTAGQRLAGSFYLWLTYTLGRVQPVQPSFFYVYGGSNAWEIEQVDPVSGERSGKLTSLVAGEDWEPIWTALGLMEKHRLLSQWLAHKATA